MSSAHPSHHITPRPGPSTSSPSPFHHHHAAAILSPSPSRHLFPPEQREHHSPQQVSPLSRVAVVNSGFPPSLATPASNELPDIFSAENPSGNFIVGSNNNNVPSDDLGDRREALALPKLTTEGASPTSSHPSSPYVSPRLPPKARQGGMGSMGEITLPPLSSAVPMRRGAVSGASSGPSLPFPPIRLPQQEEEVPSRGPSPTLGKRPSFSLGHSNHVPPGPDAHLPMPALSGSAERRGAVAVPTSFSGGSGSNGQGAGWAAGHNSSDSSNPEHSRSGAIRLAEDGTGYYYTSSSGGPGAPRSASSSSYPTYKGARSEGGDDGPGSASYNFGPSGGPGPMGRSGHFNDEPYYTAHSHGGGPAGHGGMQQGRYSNLYGRYEDSGLHGMGGRHMNYHIMSADDHLMPLNGKRPRSAPRVLSSQPRIFACSQCPARFARNHDLKRHQRGHLSVRPYPCTWCGKSFSRKDALKRHVLVKGCGKDKKGGDGAGGKDAGSRRENRSGSGEDGHSRSDEAGDHDGSEYHHDDDQSDEEDRANESQSSVQSHHSLSAAMADRHTYQPSQHYPSASSNSHYHSHPSQQHHHHHQQQQFPSHYGSHGAQGDMPGTGLYRWSKPATMPSLASHAIGSLRPGDFAGPHSSFANGLAAARRPSASIA